MGPIDYRLEGAIATITLDDGKVNAMSLGMQAAIHGAFDRAEADGAAVVLAGRPGVFSAGFDLPTLRDGGPAAAAMVVGGFRLARRLLAHPRPLVVACTGHAIAMGTFLMFAGDYRVGPTTDPCKLVANEVAIGLTMPRAALEILRIRLTPAALDRAAILAEAFPPAEAVAAGYLDRVVDSADVIPTALDLASAMLALDADAHTATKLRVRAGALRSIDEAIAADEAEYASLAEAG